MGNFVTVGKASAVQPGTMASFAVEGSSITVANIDGALCAFGDACTHKGCSLAKGTLDGKSVVCPCHGGTFDVTTGQVLAGPPQAPVATYRVRAEGDDLQIALG